MVFHTPQKKFNVPSISIEGKPITCVDDFNFFGVVIDKNLTWQEHISKVKGKLFRGLGILNKLKFFLPEKG